MQGHLVSMVSCISGASHSYVQSVLITNHPDFVFILNSSYENVHSVHFYQYIWNVAFPVSFMFTAIPIVQNTPRYSALRELLCTYKRCWKWCPRASIQAWTHLILFANTFCRSACEMFLMYTVTAVFNSLSVRGRSRYRSLSAQWLSECTVLTLKSLN